MFGTASNPIRTRNDVEVAEDKGAVAVVLVDANATSLLDFVTAVRGSPTTATVWEVSGSVPQR